MIDFLSTPPFLRIAYWVAMATVHFHIAKTGLFFGAILFRIKWVLGNHLAPMRYSPGVQGRSNQMPGYMLRYAVMCGI